MKRVLITGATGNVGLEVIKSLQQLAVPLEVLAGLRDVCFEGSEVTCYNAEPVHFDFEDIASYDAALRNCDYLFLMRPPPISDVAKYFKPLINAAKANGIQHIVFLSVQGVEKSSIIPHHKIEQWIIESGIPYTFLRPAYFMQNFIGALHHELIHHRRIFLPAGKSKFTLVDVRDIGLVAATILSAPERHQNKVYELTCNERLSFRDMAKRLSRGIGRGIKYVSPNLLNFYRIKRLEGVHRALIVVMILLHYLPRFQKVPVMTDCIKAITGKAPKSFPDFITDYKAKLLN